MTVKETTALTAVAESKGLTLQELLNQIAVKAVRERAE
jgi:hypothetical protein